MRDVIYNGGIPFSQIVASTLRHVLRQIRSSKADIII
jgi:hypothetical protein